MKLPVRIGGALTPPDSLYTMKNPFNGRYEIVADTEDTYRQHLESGQLGNMLSKMIQNGAIPEEANENS